MKTEIQICAVSGMLAGHQATVKGVVITLKPSAHAESVVDLVRVTATDCLTYPGDITIVARPLDRRLPRRKMKGSMVAFGNGNWCLKEAKPHERHGRVRPHNE